MRNKGFTLAELLIALAILGVIATFTIPKVLSSSASSQNTAIAKEMASMVSGSFSAYDLESDIATTVGPPELTPFMNYVRMSTLAADTGDLTQTCVAATPCLMLHNGGVLQYEDAADFDFDADGNLEGATDAIVFNIDPDGGGSATPATFVLYANGRLTTGDHAVGHSVDIGLTPVATDPSYIATWD